MRSQLLKSAGFMTGVIGLAGASLLAPGAQAARTAVPGTVNYIEGQVTMDGGTLTSRQDGEAQMQANQILTTQRGKAEVLLSPGVIIRVGSNSQLRMVSPELVDPQVELIRGEAMVEVDQKPKEARLDILERGSDTSLLKEGLYKFDADEGKVEVIEGKAQVQDNGQSKEFGKGKEVVLTGAELKPVSFDRKAEDELYRWSQVRSSYLAEANQSSARNVYVSGGWGGYGPGWFWNPYFSTFAWMPGDGYFMSPFGYGFYSPRYVYYAPRVPGYVGGAHVVNGGRVVNGGVVNGGVVNGGNVARSGFATAAPRASVAAPHFTAPHFTSMGGARMGGGRR